MSHRIENPWERVTRHLAATTKQVARGQRLPEEYCDHLRMYLVDEPVVETDDHWEMLVLLLKQSLMQVRRLNDSTGFANHLRAFREEVPSPHRYPEFTFSMVCDHPIELLFKQARVRFHNHIFEAMFRRFKPKTKLRDVTAVLLPVKRLIRSEIDGLHRRYKLRPANAYEILYFAGLFPQYVRDRPFTSMGVRQARKDAEVYASFEEEGIRMRRTQKPSASGFYLLAIKQEQQAG